MVALVVTIVVLLILAGITLVYVFGDNSVFKQASEAKLKTDIAQWQERLEMAKSPVFIEGLGTFDADKYFDYIQGQGIINNKETDVIDYGDGTYDVTTKPRYVFLVTLVPSKENPTDVEIEYLGEAGKLQPKIKKIDIIETTKTSFKIKVSARLEGGEVLCYYKTKADVAENEAENDITGYEIISLDSSLVGEVTSGLTAGTTYKVKAVLKKDGVDIGWVSKEVTTIILVTNITLNKATTKIDVGKSETLTVTVEPENAENKEVEWRSESPSVATVDQAGKVTGVAVGTATITVTAKDGSGKSAVCTVTVEKVESDWKKIARIAKEIAEGRGKDEDNQIVTSNSNQATVILDGKQETIKVGEEFYVKHNEIIRKVRVLGFNYDTLTDPTTAYGNETTAKTAGISFEFVEFMIDEKRAMNSSNTSSGGWGASAMRSFLNGNGGIEKISTTCKLNIKSVLKGSSDDYLWLLSVGEICGDTSGDGQYKFYQGKVTNKTSSALRKNLTTGFASTNTWWLRTVNTGSSFKMVVDVTINENVAGNLYYVAPGFAI